jgi:hypothetical protein
MEFECQEFSATNSLAYAAIDAIYPKAWFLRMCTITLFFVFPAPTVELPILASLAGRWGCIEEITAKNAPKEWRVPPAFCGIL